MFLVKRVLRQAFFRDTVLIVALCGGILYWYIDKYVPGVIE